MRDMWELPGPTAKTRLTRAAVVIGLVWAIIAVPLTAWLVLRTPPAPPEPAQRELSVMESAAVSSATGALKTGVVQVSGRIDSHLARFEVAQNVQTASGDSIGKVNSGQESADLLVTGGNVLLRGDSSFWSSVGVPTAYRGWVNVGDLLGPIAFPLDKATAALAQGPSSRIDNSASTGDTIVYRTDTASAGFTAKGLSSVTFGDRTVQVKFGADDVTGPLAAARNDAGAAAKLTGTSGALTVSEPPRPRPAPGPAPANP